MKVEKLIIFGCDYSDIYDMAIISLRESVYYNYNIIPAPRVMDLINITKSMTPDIVILCYRNNQSALNDFISLVKKPGLPVLCIIKNDFTENFNWVKNSIVFTYHLENINQSGNLNSMINSIFLLSKEKTVNIKTNRFMDHAVEDSQSRNNRDMSKIVLELDQKVDVLLKVKERIASLYTQVDNPIRAELNHIVNSIRNSVTDNKLWEDFKLYFVKTNPNFLFLLAKQYPALTQIDLKYCCYLKMNMSNDDIRNLLGINQESVRTHKYRLKKKLFLQKDQSLRVFLQSLN